MEHWGSTGSALGGSAAEVLAGLGSRIRLGRLAREMTLEELASRSGVSVAQLSRLESGMRQPSLATLLNVATGLGVPVSELLEGPDAPGPGTVVRGSEAPVFDGEGFRFQPLVPEAGPEGLAAVKVVFTADRVAPEHHRHEGQEWLYVLSGRLRLTLGDERTVLVPGDAAFFDGRLAHAFEVLGEEGAEVLLVACAHPEGARTEDPHPLREGHGVVGGARAEEAPR